MTSLQRTNRTADGRYILVPGRHWRRSQAGSDEQRRRELVRELMSARRDVGLAKRTGDLTAERAARARVQATKVALGGRATPWWQQPQATATQLPN